MEFNIYENGYYLGNDNNPYYIFVETISKDVASVSVNNRTEIITSGAFSHCYNLDTIFIPSSVHTIDRVILTSSNVKEMIFEDPNGWWVANNNAEGTNRGTSISAEKMSNSTTVMDLFDTYDQKYWFKGNRKY